MNKTFQKILSKAKSENRSCFVAFVTGMDPDYESSKQILIELSKYCDCIEIGVSFNTSTSDSSIIMSANDRAIKSGAKTEKIFQLIKEVKSEINSPTVPTNSCGDYVSLLDVNALRSKFQLDL